MQLQYIKKPQHSLPHTNHIAPPSLSLFISVFCTFPKQFYKQQSHNQFNVKEESNILTDPCRLLGKRPASLVLYWSLLGWVTAARHGAPVQSRTIHKGNSYWANYCLYLHTKNQGNSYLHNNYSTGHLCSTCQWISGLSSYQNTQTQCNV